MDRIEPAEDGNSRGSPPDNQSGETSPPRPALSTLQSPGRPRAPSARSRRPSIRLSRLPSLPSLDTENPQPQPVTPGPSLQRQVSIRSPVAEEDESAHSGRRRSNSEPRPGRYSGPSSDALSRAATPMRMNPLAEESSRSPLPTPLAPAQQPESGAPDVEEAEEAPPPVQRSMLRRTSQAALRPFTRNRASTVTGAPQQTVPENQEVGINEYGPHVVDVLDVIDPEVSALSTLTNVQNSLFVPNLGGWINRMPTYTLTRRPPPDEEQGTSTDEGEVSDDNKQRPTLEQLRPFSSMSSVLAGPRYAVLPEGHDDELAGWTNEDFAELNDHVRHMLHSRRSKFKRAMKGFGQYVRKPLGFLVTLYATLITLFGLAWVLFLIGWINVAGKQSYLINIIDNVLVGLFAIMAVDTYHMIFIAHYTHKTWEIRDKRKLPDLKDKNDLPARPEKDVDVEFGDTPKDEEHEFTVLERAQQLKLQHHQNKFAKSHTFYKPHETLTHHAFPMRMLVAIVVILDCHSLLQMALGACTWSMEPPKYRPFALTTVILCCSITCNITGGIMIMIGDRMTRKKDIVERLFRQQLTEEAMKKMEKRKIKEERRSMQIDQERRSMQVDQERRSMQVDRELRGVPEPYIAS
ncbi:hypothetical protein N7494_002000 [Penicillium frequentans]|uniref:Integral membrane protein n=1 Tax=Penicillium frequentans TaxID=3151616 RepID=A0AAD6D2U0_9EURO|nr:hypothetical protein N7494_002000 [Penicillium glabrum]